LLVPELRHLFVAVPPDGKASKVVLIYAISTNKKRTAERIRPRGSIEHDHDVCYKDGFIDAKADGGLRLTAKGKETAYRKL
jgi:hypothetical protein